MLEKIKEFNEAFRIPYAKSFTISDTEGIDLYLKLLKEEIKEFEEAIAWRDDIEALDGVVDAAYVLFGLIYKIGAQNIFEKAFEEVHASNMSKLENGEPLFREDGKVLKGNNYFKPNLKQFIHL